MLSSSVFAGPTYVGPLQVWSCPPALPDGELVGLCYGESEYAYFVRKAREHEQALAGMAAATAVDEFLEAREAGDDSCTPESVLEARPVAYDEAWGDYSWEPPRPDPEETETAAEDGCPWPLPADEDGGWPYPDDDGPLAGIPAPADEDRDDGDVLCC